MNTLAIIHIAKKELGLDEDTFRAALTNVTGKRSTRDMNERERLAVIDHFKAKGFTVKRGGKFGAQSLCASHIRFVVIVRPFGRDR